MEAKGVVKYPGARRAVSLVILDGACAGAHYKADGTRQGSVSTVPRHLEASTTKVTDLGSPAFLAFCLSGSSYSNQMRRKRITQPKTHVHATVQKVYRYTKQSRELNWDRFWCGCLAGDQGVFGPLEPGLRYPGSPQRVTVARQRLT
jgi:hypothetical protein